jgi:FMN-dependent NADH-azoreductase
MLKAKRAILVCARGLGYLDGTPLSEEQFDYQKAYLITWLNFIGVAEIQTIKVEKTLFGEEALSASIAAGLQDAKDLANSLEKAA